MKFHTFFLAFFINIHTLLNFTYNFFYEPDNPSTGGFNPYLSPTYSLGTLATSKTLNIKVTLLNKNTQDLSSLTVSLYQQTSSSPLTYQSVSLTTVKTNATYLEYSYNIVITGSITQAPFYVRVLSNTFVDLNYFYLQVLYYSTGLPSTTSAAKSILKVTQTQRSIINRFIYVASPTNLVLSFFPTLSANNNFNLRVSAIDKADWSRVNGFRPTVQIPFNNNFNDLLQVQTFKSNFTVNPGFYLVQVGYTSSSSNKINLHMTFQTDTYKCPYTALYEDVRKNFQGCSSKSLPTSPKNSKGFPCVNFNENTRECLQCIDGYTLVDNRCLESNLCPDRQYFHYGNCLSVSPTCGNYDHFTGICLNCSDSLNFKLENGQCTSINVTCTDRQWKSNNTCFNVSVFCDTFDENTGLCLTCISNSSKLDADGTCSPVDVACGDGFYVSGVNCLPIPVECLIFNSTLGQCQICLAGYIVQNGKCQPIICPRGMVPSRYGSHCVRVSQLCDNYDNVTGDCLTCRERNHIVKQGKCLQISSSLAGCREREKLGFGQCKSTKENCQIYNLLTGNCDKCNDNCYLDFTGHCVPSHPCQDPQNGSNTNCPEVPLNCLAIDRAGLCRKCLRGFILSNGMCVNQICTGNKYPNRNGQCVEYSANRNCIDCRQAMNPLNNENCC